MDLVGALNVFTDHIGFSALNGTADDRSAGSSFI